MWCLIIADIAEGTKERTGLLLLSTPKEQTAALSNASYAEGIRPQNGSIIDEAGLGEKEDM